MKEQGKTTNRPVRMAMATRGAWGHLLVAGMLITVLPALFLLWLYISASRGVGDSASALLYAGVAWIGFACLGYALLIKYPLSIVRLRSYLHRLANDQLPDQVTSPPAEDDIVAIHGYLEHIVNMAAERLRLLKEKHEADIAKERHRVTMESIGALCHHIGQPASVLGVQLHLAKRAASEQHTLAMIAECESAFEDMTNTLDRLRHIATYETEGYLEWESEILEILRLPDG